MHKIFGAFMGTSIIFLIEKTLIQYISIDYHRKQFESKIRESKRNFELLGHLYDASRERAPEYTPRYADHDARIRDEEMSAGNPLELFQSIGRLGGRATSDFATNAFGNIARDITGKQVMDPNSAHSIITRALETERSSSALAHRLWLSFVGEDESILSREHLLVCLGTQRHSIAEEAFNHLDRDENGDVTFEEFNLTIRQWGRDRDSINSSIHDVDHAVNALDALLKIVVFLVAVIIFGMSRL